MGDIGDRKRKTIEVLPDSLPEPVAQPAEAPRAPAPAVPATPSRTSVG